MKKFLNGKSLFVTMLISSMLYNATSHAAGPFMYGNLDIPAEKQIGSFFKGVSQLGYSIAERAKLINPPTSKHSTPTPLPSPAPEPITTTDNSQLFSSSLADQLTEAQKSRDIFEQEAIQKLNVIQNKAAGYAAENAILAQTNASLLEALEAEKSRSLLISQPQKFTDEAEKFSGWLKYTHSEYENWETDKPWYGIPIVLRNIMRAPVQTIKNHPLKTIGSLAAIAALTIAYQHYRANKIKKAAQNVAEDLAQAMEEAKKAGVMAPGVHHARLDIPFTNELIEDLKTIEANRLHSMVALPKRKR